MIWQRTADGGYVARLESNLADINAYSIEPPRRGERRQWRITSVKSGEPRYHGNPQTLGQAKEACERMLAQELHWAAEEAAGRPFTFLPRP